MQLFTILGPEVQFEDRGRDADGANWVFRSGAAREHAHSNYKTKPRGAGGGLSWRGKKRSGHAQLPATDREDRRQELRSKGKRALWAS